MRPLYIVLALLLAASLSAWGQPIQTFELNALGQDEPLVITPSVIGKRPPTLPGFTLPAYDVDWLESGPNTEGVFLISSFPPDFHLPWVRIPKDKFTPEQHSLIQLIFRYSSASSPMDIAAVGEIVRHGPPELLAALKGNNQVGGNQILKWRKGGLLMGRAYYTLCVFDSSGKYSKGIGDRVIVLTNSDGKVTAWLKSQCHVPYLAATLQGPPGDRVRYLQTVNDWGIFARDLHLECYRLEPDKITLLPGNSTDEIRKSLSADQPTPPAIPIFK